MRPVAQGLIVWWCSEALIQLFTSRRRPILQRMKSTKVQILSTCTCICTSAIYSITAAVAGPWELEGVVLQSTCTSACTFHHVEKNGQLRIAIQYWISATEGFQRKPHKFFTFVACRVHSIFRTNKHSRGEMWLKRQTESTTVTLTAHACQGLTRKQNGYIYTIHNKM